MRIKLRNGCCDLRAKRMNPNIAMNTTNVERNIANPNIAMNPDIAMNATNVLNTTNKRVLPMSRHSPSAQEKSGESGAS